MGRFDKTFGKDKEAKFNEKIESGLEAQQGLHNLRPSAVFGTEPPQVAMPQPKKELRPYDNPYAGQGAGDAKDLMAGSAVMDKIDAADKRNQLKQLEDLEMIGAFEEPDSDVNVRAAKLRALLGK
jgi:hypothetical protein